jgi:hypothetical protein
MFRRDDIQVPDPEDFGPKEVYAFFGLAAYCAQILERGVMTLAAALHLGGAERVTDDLIDELFDTFESKTLGQVLRAAREASPLPDDVDERLGQALGSRNRLTHTFYWDHAENFLSDVGRGLMIHELQQLIQAFKAADRQVMGVVLSVMARFGITEDLLVREFEALKLRAEQADAD